MSSARARSARWRALASLTRTLAAALLLGMGSGAGHSATATGAASAAPAVQFYDGGFECYAGPLALRLPDTYTQLPRLGEIRSARDVRTQTRRTQTGHGLATTERQIEFRGLILRVYLFSGDPGRYQVVSVQISSPAWQLSPLRVDERIDAVSLASGWPRPPRQGSWEVQGDSAHLLVSSRAGRIATVDYVCDSAR